MDTYWWDTFGRDTFGMDMCGICMMCWICMDMCGDWWDTYYNLLNGYALHGYVLVGYVWVGYVWNGYVWDMCDVLDMCGICVVDTFGMDMCGICVMCWICVGYVWCEIRKQSSEEPCDETSFGKKLDTSAGGSIQHPQSKTTKKVIKDFMPKHSSAAYFFWVEDGTHERLGV